MTDNEYIQELARVREVLRRFRPLECDVEYLLACKDPKMLVLTQRPSWYKLHERYHIYDVHKRGFRPLKLSSHIEFYNSPQSSYPPQTTRNIVLPLVISISCLFVLSSKVLTYALSAGISMVRSSCTSLDKFCTVCMSLPISISDTSLISIPSPQLYPRCSVFLV